MADGRETRATIDSVTVRRLLLFKVGGAVARLAFAQAPHRLSYSVLNLAIQRRN